MISLTYQNHTYKSANAFALFHTSAMITLALAMITL